MSRLGLDVDRESTSCSVVTGAFGFTGKYIAKRLLEGGERVRTLTNHPDAPAGWAQQIEAAPMDFEDEDGLARSIKGAKVLYNTYWVRFAWGNVDHEKAVANTRVLIRAAERAGVERIVHVSITNPSLDSSLPYFRGKAQVEEAIRASRMSWAILRPAVVFGPEDILINNIAWLLRRFPFFAVPGRGDYALQPIFAEDMARLAVDCGRGCGNVVMDAVGPETYTYVDLVRLVARVVGSRARVVHLPAGVVVVLSKGLSWMLNDVLLTSDEVKGLMEGLLVSRGGATGHTSLKCWLEENAGRVGKEYASELRRHYHSR